MSAAPTVVDWLTLGVAGVGAATGVASLFVSIKTAAIARRTALQLFKREHHFEQLEALMRTALQLDVAVTALTSRGPDRDRRPEDERRGAFSAALDAYSQAADDVAARAPADVRAAADRFGNLVISFRNNPGAFGDQVLEARGSLDQLIRRELGTDETG